LRDKVKKSEEELRRMEKGRVRKDEER